VPDNRPRVVIVAQSPSPAPGFRSPPSSKAARSAATFEAPTQRTCRVAGPEPAELTTSRAQILNQGPELASSSTLVPSIVHDPGLSPWRTTQTGLPRVTGVRRSGSACGGCNNLHKGVCTLSQPHQFVLGRVRLDGQEITSGGNGRLFVAVPAGAFRWRPAPGTRRPAPGGSWWSRWLEFCPASSGRRWVAHSFG
jgi:hypothetical protein